MPFPHDQQPSVADSLEYKVPVRYGPATSYREVRPASCPRRMHQQAAPSAPPLGTIQSTPRTSRLFVSSVPIGTTGTPPTSPWRPIDGRVIRTTSRGPGRSPLHSLLAETPSPPPPLARSRDHQQQSESPAAPTPVSCLGRHVLPPLSNRPTGSPPASSSVVPEEWDSSRSAATIGSVIDVYNGFMQQQSQLLVQLYERLGQIQHAVLRQNGSAPASLQQSIAQLEKQIQASTQGLEAQLAELRRAQTSQTNAKAPRQKPARRTTSASRATGAKKEASKGPPAAETGNPEAPTTRPCSKKNCAATPRRSSPRRRSKAAATAVDETAAAADPCVPSIAPRSAIDMASSDTALRTIVAEELQRVKHEFLQVLQQAVADSTSLPIAADTTTKSSHRRSPSRESSFRLVSAGRCDRSNSVMSQGSPVSTPLFYEGTPMLLPSVSPDEPSETSSNDSLDMGPTMHAFDNNLRLRAILQHCIELIEAKKSADPATAN